VQVLRPRLDDLQARHRLVPIGIRQAGIRQRIIFSTTDRWNPHPDDAINGQAVPVRRVGMADLEASPIDRGSSI
jgi:predicted helicase